MLLIKLLNKCKIRLHVLQHHDSTPPTFLADWTINQNIKLIINFKIRKGNSINANKYY